MNRVRVKFCGFTRVEDVRDAVALGVDAVGLVLTPRSRRFADLAQASALRDAIPPFVSAVALFMDDEPEWIVRALAAVQPDLLQFHGSESAGECTRYGCRYVKAIGMGEADALATMARHPHAGAFLLDSHSAGEAGGTGRAFDWSRVPQMPQMSGRPLILAGGLTCDNVHSAVRRVRPYAVDVSSGIESAPGIKDPDRMRRFIEEVQRACSESED